MEAPSASPRSFTFDASLPLSGVVTRILGKGRVLLTLEAPQSDRPTALLVAALVGCHFRVTLALPALPDGDTFVLGARLPRTGTVGRAMGDGPVRLTLEADKADGPIALAVAELTECPLRVTVAIDEVDADGPPAYRPTPRRSSAKRRVA